MAKDDLVCVQQCMCLLQGIDWQPTEWGHTYKKPSDQGKNMVWGNSAVVVGVSFISAIIENGR